MRAIAKWLLSLLVAVFPYFCLMGLYHDGVRALFPNPFILIELFWLAELVLALAVLFTRKGWTVRELALANMLVKLVHIPAYVFWFAAGILFFLFMGAPLAFMMDAMAISLSGLVGLGAVLRCKKEGILTGKQTVIHGILQFVFCADVVSAIILYRKTKEVSL